MDLGTWATISVAIASVSPVAEEKGVRFQSAPSYITMNQAEPAIGFNVYFEISGYQGDACTAMLTFFHQDWKPLQDRNGEYAASDGTVGTWQDFVPAFAFSRYAPFRMYIPSSEFHLAPGKHDLRVLVSFFHRDENQQWVSLTAPQETSVSLEVFLPASGEIVRWEVQSNSPGEGGPGVIVQADVRARRARGRTLRIRIQFYHSLEVLGKRVYRRLGKEEGEPLEHTTEIAGTEEESEAKGVRARLPLKLFPLKVGDNRFFVKTRLEVRWDDGRWYELDATNARWFDVPNGETRLQEVLVLEELRVALDWEATEPQKKSLREILMEMNRGLYDATDGQVRIARFRFQRAPSGHDHDQLVLRVYEDFQKGDHGEIAASSLLAQGRAFAGGFGTPSNPKDIHLPAKSLFDPEERHLAAGLLVHEFGHAYFGLPDEYWDLPPDDGGRSFSQPLCPSSESQRVDSSACLMSASDSWMRELCRPGSHADHSRLSEVDCYSLVQRRIREWNGKEMVIPRESLGGPRNPPEPTFVE